MGIRIPVLSRPILALARFRLRSAKNLVTWNA